MTLSTAPVPLFFGPLTVDWTIHDLLEWTGADDARCHDGRLLPILDAVGAALGSSPTPSRGRVVTHVRLVASLVGADPTVGERTLGTLVGPQERVERDLVPA